VSDKRIEPTFYLVKEKEKVKNPILKAQMFLVENLSDNKSTDYEVFQGTADEIFHRALEIEKETGYECGYYVITE